MTTSTADGSFATTVTLTRASIAAFADLIGDGNPVHRDPACSAARRFGGVIASGPHVSSLMMGLTATHFAAEGDMLGLEFRFRFRRPVRPDVPVRLAWRPVGHRRSKASLGGDLVVLVGEATAPDGDVLVRSVGKVLVSPRGSEPPRTRRADRR